MENNLRKLAEEWLKGVDKVQSAGVLHCQTRDEFNARLEKMAQNLIEGGFSENDSYIISAMAGEIGNNSFDHNVGNWAGKPGVFFGYTAKENSLEIILADEGVGVLNTLKRVKPELKTNTEALQTAFNEKISGRAPENRGNGLKFVRDKIQETKLHLFFVSGKAKIDVNEKIEIKEIAENYQGCLALITMDKK